MSFDSAAESRFSRPPFAGYPWSPGHFYRPRNPSAAEDSSGPGFRVPNGHGWAASGRLQRLTTGRRPRRCQSLQTQVRENLFNHRLLQDRRNDLQFTAAVRAVLHIDLEHALDRILSMRCETKASTSALFGRCDRAALKAVMELNQCARIAARILE